MVNLETFEAYSGTRMPPLKFAITIIKVSNEGVVLIDS